MLGKTHAVMSAVLAIVGELERKIKILRAQLLHNALQFVLAVRGDAHGFALDLRFGFGEVALDELGDFFGFVLAEALQERHVFAGFEVAFDNVVRGGVQNFLALAAASEFFTDDVDDGVDLPVARANNFQPGLVVVEPLNRGRRALKIVARANFALRLVEDVVHLGLVVFRNNIK